eukprot:7319829-Lingulodinium_polyedra.AAC.1
MCIRDRHNDAVAVVARRHSGSHLARVARTVRTAKLLFVWGVRRAQNASCCCGALLRRAATPTASLCGVFRALHNDAVAIAIR